MTTYPFAANAPIHVAKVGLKARDADALAGYYGRLLGLVELRREAGAIVLGVEGDGLELLEIEPAPSARRDDPREAGLFHTAFLLPSRADLGRWIRFAAENRFRLEGASDHLVSEALYLTDPEGNGIEIYADRPPESWTRDGKHVSVATLPLDLKAVTEAAPAGTEWEGAPAGTIIGHVHLRVGDPAAAEDWWRTELGFDLVARYGDKAVFLSTGGYHHHVGANSWQSAGAGPRDPDRAGLAFIEMKTRDGRAKTLNDPWGTEIRLAG